MISRISKTFAQLGARDEGALVAFVTAGDPYIDKMPALVAAIAEGGADIVELGIPYSDPLADGPSIQASSQRALERGVTPDTVLQMVREIRTLTSVPLVLMTSYNLVLRYGLQRFAQAASEAGADGAILTDLPPEEAAPWKREAEAHDIATIFLVTPVSTPARIQTIADSTTGFVYCVSRTGVTGAREDVPPEVQKMLSRVRAATDKPLCVGFGISTPAHVAHIVQAADGAVVGSALVDFLHAHAESPTLMDDVRAMVGAWKDATRRKKG